MTHHSINAIQRAIASSNDVRANYATFLVTTSSPVPDGAFTVVVNLDAQQFGAKQYCPEVPHADMPKYPVGSLAMITDGQQCTCAGMFIRELADEVAPSFEIIVMQMQSPTAISPLVRCSVNGQTAAGYRFNEDPSFFGSVQSISAVGAQRLRRDIGHAVDPRVLEIFWSPAEREALTQEAAERQRFDAALKAMITALENQDVAA